MYIENLQTPHPRTIYPGQETASFLAEANLEQYAQNIAQADDFDRAADQAVLEIVRSGRRALRFPNDDMKPETKGDTTFEMLRQEQITTCLGYTAVLSECLTEAEIPHYIGFANSHWMVLRPSADQERLKMTDMLSPIFNQDITSMISKGSPRSIANAIAKRKRSAVMLTTTGFQAGSHKTMDELAGDYPWVTIAQHVSPDNHQHTDDASKYRHDHTLILSAFDADVGMQVMHEYAYFQSAMTKSNLGDASERLHNMRGLYPEVDARAPHKEIRRLIKGLCATEEFELAIRVAEDYSSSFDVSDDPRLKELQGDMYRYIGKASHDPGSAKLSYQAYEAAASSSRKSSSSKILGKVAASSSLIEQLDAQG